MIMIKSCDDEKEKCYCWIKSMYSTFYSTITFFFLIITATYHYHPHSQLIALFYIPFVHLALRSHEFVHESLCVSSNMYWCMKAWLVVEWCMRCDVLYSPCTMQLFTHTIGENGPTRSLNILLLRHYLLNTSKMVWSQPTIVWSIIGKLPRLLATRKRRYLIRLKIFLWYWQIMNRDLGISLLHIYPVGEKT